MTSSNERQRDAVPLQDHDVLLDVVADLEHAGFFEQRLEPRQRLGSPGSVRPPGRRRPAGRRRRDGRAARSRPRWAAAPSRCRRSRPASDRARTCAASSPTTPSRVACAIQSSSAEISAMRVIARMLHLGARGLGLAAPRPGPRACSRSLARRRGSRAADAGETDRRSAARATSASGSSISSAGAAIPLAREPRIGRHRVGIDLRRTPRRAGSGR